MTTTSIQCLAQLTHRDDAHRFTLTVPKGWVESPDVLDFMNKFVKERVPDGGFEYIAAFVPSEGLTDDSPYVVIQYSTLPAGGATYEAVEAALKAQSLQEAVEKSTQGAKDAIGKYTVGVPTLDRSTNRVYLRIKGGSGGAGGAGGSDSSGSAQQGQPPAQKFDSLCIGTLTSHGIIQINSYSIEGSNVDPAAQAETFLAGLKIDDGTKFVPLTLGQPTTTPSVAKTVVGKLGNSLVRGLIIAGIVTAIALLYAVWSVRREKNKQG